MAVRIAAGRTRRLLPRVVREIGEAYAGGAHCLLLVPEQYTLQAELELTERLRLPGFFDLEVLSPTRLTQRVFERAGAPAQVRIDQRGKHMVLRCVLEELGDTLRFYGRAARRRGFVDKLAALVADLKRSQLAPEALAAVAESLPEGALRLKLEDVARVYAAYERRLAGRFVDGEDVEDAVRARLAASALLDGAHVWVYGFDTLTQQFARTLVTMAALADTLCVTLVMDEPPCRDAGIYQPVRQSADRLARMLREAGIPCERTREEGALAASPAIRHVERELYAYPARPMDAPPEGLTLQSAATPYAEVHLAAAQILQWVRDEGFAWRDIAVQYTDPVPYAGLLAHVLAQYGIPAYIDEKRSAERHPLVVGLLGALRCATQGWRHEDAMAYLKSGFSGLTDEEGFVLERYALEQGLRGARWKAPLTRGGEALCAQVEPLRARFAEPMAALQAHMREARDADATLRALADFLREIGAFDTLEAYRQALEGAGLPTEAAHSAQVWAHLMDTLDQMHTLLDGQRGAAGLVVEMLSAGLAAAELGALPPSPDALLCGALGHVRTGTVRALLVLGLGDGKLGGGQADLLEDAERQQTEALAGAHLGMAETARAQLMRLDVLQALTLPTERLWLSYPVADTAGAAQRPSMVCAQLQRIFPRLAVRGGTLEEGQAGSLSAPRAALEALGPALRAAVEGQPLPEASRAAYAVLAGDDAWRDALGNLLQGLSATVQAPPLAREVAEVTVARGQRYSISRLETFAACPYQHFVQYGLRPKPWEPYGVRPNELGTWYHHALEGFTRLALDTPGWPRVTRAQCDALVEEATRPLMADWGHGPLGEDAHAQALGRQVCAVARRAAWTLTHQMQNGGFMPAHMELNFGAEEAPPVALALPAGGEAFLHGRIDRIDLWTHEGAQYLRVVDYKASHHPPELDGARLYAGLQQQLPIYLRAALAAWPEARPAGMFYFRVDDPLLRERVASAESAEEKQQRELALRGVMLRDEAVVRALGKGDTLTARGTIHAGQSHGIPATPEQMRLLLDYTCAQAAGFAQRIAEGDIAVRPVQLKAWHACQYCQWASLCGIDPLLEGGRPRALAPMDMDTLFALLAQEKERDDGGV